jgi:type IV secretory pathway VirB10-like protein
MADEVKKDGPQDSPDGLGFKTKPKGVVRVNKKAIGIGMFALTAVLLAIMVGVVTRKPAATIKQDGETTARLEPALAAGEKILRDIPDGNLPERKAKDAALGGAPGVIDTPNAGDGNLTPAAVPPLAGAPLPGAAAPGGPPQVDPAVERARRLAEEREARLKQAIEAGTTPQGQGGAGGGFQFANAGGAPGAQPTALQQLQAMAAAQARPGGGAPALVPPGLPGREEDDQNKQARKEQFLRDMEATPDRNFVKNTRTAALSKYEVKAGWNIPATLQHGINSDLPGKITALVSQNVFDTASGRHLMIPQGATLVGTYDSHVAYGQNRLLVVWRRIIYPDGSSIDLEGMGGVDESGYSGFRDQVNNHYGRIIGFGLLTSLFSAAFQISQNEKQTVTGTPTPSQTAGTAVAQQLSQLGIEIARKNLRVQPTIEIRPGYQFNVRVEKDLVFPRPYAYGNAQ